MNFIKAIKVLLITLSMNFIKAVVTTVIFFVLVIICMILLGCATCNPDSFRLPNGYSLVQDSGQKYRVKCPDGYLTEAQWMTEDGAVGYAISYDEFYKKSH